MVITTIPLTTGLDWVEKVSAGNRNTNYSPDSSGTPAVMFNIWKME